MSMSMSVITFFAISKMYTCPCLCVFVQRHESDPANPITEQSGKREKQPLTFPTTLLFGNLIGMSNHQLLTFQNPERPSENKELS